MDLKFREEETKILTQFYRTVNNIKNLHLGEKYSPKGSILDTNHILSLIGYIGVTNDLETWPIFLYFFSAVFCLGSSTIFHWFNAKSAYTFKMLNRIDLASITMLIWGSSNSVMYYVFYCEEIWFYIYGGILTVACFCVFTTSMRDWIYLHQHRKTKGNMYVCLGLFSALGAFHIVIQE